MDGCTSSYGFLHLSQFQSASRALERIWGSTAARENWIFSVAPATTGEPIDPNIEIRNLIPQLCAVRMILSRRTTTARSFCERRMARHALASACYDVTQSKYAKPPLNSYQKMVANTTALKRPRVSPSRQ